MEIYKDLTNQASKEFEQLLNSQLSKTKIEEGKIIEGKINKKTNFSVIFVIFPSMTLPSSIFVFDSCAFSSFSNSFDAGVSNSL